MRWKFVDSYKLIPGSLKRLTEEYNVEHKKLDKDFLSIEYNRHDCLGLYEVLTLFFDQFDICSETIASHAMRVFRTNFLHKRFPIPRREIEDFVRKSYCGGRCEVYRFDKAKLNHYDINSLYPTAMLESVPVEYKHPTSKLPDNENEIGFYDVLVQVPEMYLPPLPFSKGKLIFPTGTFRACFCSIELQGALDRGCKILHIYRGELFQAEPVLREYAEGLYLLKQSATLEGKGATRHTAKILLNSLYGKFAQGREHWTYKSTSQCKPNDEIYPLPKSPDLALVWSESHASFILPHIAATITSRSRMIQLHLLELSHGFKSRLYYTDTDSVFTDSQLPVGNEIGQLKQEGAGVFEAYGPKEYYFDGAYKVKGVPRSEAESKAKKDEEDRELAERYLRGDEIQTYAIAGFRESLRLGKETVRRIERIKKRHTRIEKRVRVGKDTRPWNLEEFFQVNAPPALTFGF